MILVADDDRVFNHLICRGLRQAGYTVLSAFDAFQASTMILRGDFEAVILDIQMPAGTGLEVLKRLKRRPWKGRRSGNRCEGSNPSFSAINTYIMRL